MTLLKMPADTHRHAVFGMTGTGKTLYATWCLAHRSFDVMPWIILDFKREDLFDKLPQIEEIRCTDKIPKQRGLYIVRPTLDETDDGEVTALMFRIWERERTGLYIDEGYMIKPRDKGLRTLLTQGRSKRTPIIALSQRPAWVSPYIHSESEYKSIFQLITPADITRVKEWLPPRDPQGRPVDPGNLPPHHSYWYDLPNRTLARLGPCPPEPEVLDIFDARRYRRSWF